MVMSPPLKPLKPHTKRNPHHSQWCKKQTKSWERLLPNNNIHNDARNKQNHERDFLPNYSIKKKLVQNTSSLKILCFHIFEGFFNDEVDPMFISILWSYSSGNHPWLYLTKFDDIQNMKEENL
jgi:hypothetical protein